MNKDVYYGYLRPLNGETVAVDTSSEQNPSTNPNLTACREYERWRGRLRSDRISF